MKSRFSQRDEKKRKKDEGRTESTRKRKKRKQSETAACPTSIGRRQAQAIKLQLQRVNGTNNEFQKLKQNAQ